MPHFKHFRRLAQICLTAVVLHGGATWAQSGACQLQASQQEKNWPFEIEVSAPMPTWSATRGAAELYKAQSKFLSNNASPFAKNKIPPELGYYQPNISLKITPYVTYTQTIDGRRCAQVVGAKLIISQTPEILLPKELAARNCVSRTALEHQLRHHAATGEALRAVAADKADIKSEIFPIYQKQGAAGGTPMEVLQALEALEHAATGPLYGKISKLLLQERKNKVITQDIFGQLYAACSGEFEQSSALAQPSGGH